MIDIPQTPPRDSRLAGPLASQAVTIADARELLRPFVGQLVSRQTMLNWLRKGKFPGARQKTTLANSQWIIPWDDLVTYVQSAYPSGPIKGIIPPPALGQRFDALLNAAYLEV